MGKFRHLMHIPPSTRSACVVIWACGVLVLGASTAPSPTVDELEKYRSKSRKVLPRHGCKEEDFLADSMLGHTEDIIFSSQQLQAFNSNNAVRVNEFNSNIFPVKNTPHSSYQPPQQQMFAPTPGTYTPDIYSSAAPHNMVLSTGGQLYAPQPDYASTAPPQTDHRPIEPAHTQAWLTQLPPPPPTKMQRYNNKNLVLLQQRKQEIVNQLERNRCNTPLRLDAQTCTSSYSIWNSGGILHTTTGPNSQATLTSSYPILYRSDSVLTDDEFIPFEPPIVSKYGPISRAAAAAAKALMRPQAVQSSAVFGDATISTPGLRRPVPAPSPVTPPWPPQYNGYPQQVLSPTTSNLGDYITIGHGIIDPPQILHRPPPVDQNKELMVQLINLEKQINKIKQQQKQEMLEKEKEWRISQLVPNHGGVGTMSWSNDGWSSTGYQSDDEDSFDIAHNMRELELTLQGELEEEDGKLWPNDDESNK